jgi:hypothetical protein
MSVLLTDDQVWECLKKGNVHDPWGVACRAQALHIITQLEGLREKNYWSEDFGLAVSDYILSARQELEAPK